MQNIKRDTDVQNRLLDSVGEGEGGMFRENTYISIVYIPHTTYSSIHSSENGHLVCIHVLAIVNRTAMN